MAAAKEAANAATHFLWTQLRALGSHLEARAWHKRDLTKAELAAKVPITGIHSAPSKAQPSAPAVKKAVLGGKRAAAPAQKHAEQQSKAAQQESNAAPSPAGKKRKRQELASHPIDPLSEGDPSQGSSKAVKQAALRSHPIDADEGMLSPSGLQSDGSTLAHQSPANMTGNGPSLAAHQNGQQGMGSPESLDQLAARARLHRHHVLSDPSPSETANVKNAPTSNGAVPAMRTPHDSSTGTCSGRQDPYSQGVVGDRATLSAGALNGGDTEEGLSQAPSQDKAGEEAGMQEALTPEKELARQREIAKQDAAQIATILQVLNQQLGRIWQAVPTNGLLIIMAGHGDTAEVRRLQVVTAQNSRYAPFPHGVSTPCTSMSCPVITLTAEYNFACLLSCCSAGLRPQCLQITMSRQMVETSEAFPDWVSLLQEQKWRRQQGLDGMPSWTTAAEEALAQAMHNALQGMCFCAVKQ